MKIPSTIILANGDFPVSPRLIEALRTAGHVVACDGAAVALIESGLREPDAVVGDLDSLPRQVRECCRGQIFQEREQDTNDLSKAFRFCIKRGWTEDGVLILGATGKRDDHTLGNIALLFDFAGTVANVQLWTDYGRFVPLPASGTLPAYPGQQVSIFSADPSQAITSKGLVYPLEELHLTRWWNATLNEAVGDEFSLQFSGAPLVVYSPWQGLDAKHPRAAAPRFPWRKVHFCGAGGVGMAGLAHIALDAGCMITGTDAVSSPMLNSLIARGAEVKVGADPAALPADCELLVYSAAIPQNHPERVAAAKRGIPQCSRGQFLARVAPLFQRVVAIAGSHGKTTTSAMLAHILKFAGTAPGYLVGGMVGGWQRSAAAGSWETLVTEVDESDRSQELMLPTLSVILNIDDDHSWGIGGTAGLEECFARLAKNSLQTLTWQDDELMRILKDSPMLTLLDKASVEDIPQMPVDGEHNRMDAAAALRAAELLGIDRQTALDALALFPGVDRRLSLRWSSPDGKRVLIDDYAHHPSELEAGLKTLRNKYPSHRLVVYFQPHRPERLLRYGQRFADILKCLSDEAVIVTPFMAWEINAPEADPQILADAVNGRLADCNPELLAEEISERLHSPDGTPVLVAVVGAGDIGRVTKLVRR